VRRSPAARETVRTLFWVGALAAGIFAARAASVWPAAVDLLYARGLFPAIAFALGVPARVVPFSLAQILLAALALAGAAWLFVRIGQAVRIRSLRRLFGRPSRLAAVAALTVWAFQLSWGLNHAREPLDRRLALPRVEQSSERLTRLVRTLAREVNRSHAWAVEAGQFDGGPLAEDGSLDGGPPPAAGMRDGGPPPAAGMRDGGPPPAAGMRDEKPPPAAGMRDEGPLAAQDRSDDRPPVADDPREGAHGSRLRIDRRVVADRLAAAYGSLLPPFHRVPVSDPKVPKLLGWILPRLGLSGFYFPFTGEASVVGTLPDAALVFVMAHEMAHQRGIAREDEANFLAFLACRESGLASARYAGSLGAFGLAYNALWRTAPDSAHALGSRLLDPGPRQDRQAIREYWNRHTSPAEPIAQRANDAYLKASGHSAGVGSYSLAVRWLLALDAAGGLDEPD